MPMQMRVSNLCFLLTILFCSGIGSSEDQSMTEMIKYRVQLQVSGEEGEKSVKKELASAIGSLPSVILVGDHPKWVIDVIVNAKPQEINEKPIFAVSYTILQRVKPTTINTYEIRNFTIKRGKNADYIPAPPTFWENKIKEDIKNINLYSFPMLAHRLIVTTDPP